MNLRVVGPHVARDGPCDDLTNLWLAKRLESESFLSTGWKQPEVETSWDPRRLVATVTEIKRIADVCVINALLSEVSLTI